MAGGATIRRITGEVFSDLGRAASFMALEWVQAALKNDLGFTPFAATLNLRPVSPGDQKEWEAVRSELRGMALSVGASGYCAARLYRVEIQRSAHKTNGAVLVPNVVDYPRDKIEVIAPVRLKDALGVTDGDRLTLEFVN